MISTPGTNVVDIIAIVTHFIYVYRWQPYKIKYDYCVFAWPRFLQVFRDNGSRYNCEVIVLLTCCFSFSPAFCCKFLVTLKMGGIKFPTQEESFLEFLTEVEERIGRILAGIFSVGMKFSYFLIIKETFMSCVFLFLVHSFCIVFTCYILFLPCFYLKDQFQ